MITNINEFKKNESNERRMDENVDTDISLIEDSLPSEKWSGSWFTDFFTTKNNDKIYIGIVVGSKRGYPRDAYIKALNTSKPKLPSGFTYTTGTPVNMYTNTPVTLKSIKEDDEYYDDRGYTDSEFDGEVYYEVTKTTNESNEQRGYVTYEYDLDKKTLTKIDSGVTSEYNMWGTIYDNDYNAVLPFPEDKKDIQKVFKDRKLTLYRLGTSYDIDAIIDSIENWLYNNHFIGRGIGRMDENIDTTTIPKALEDIDERRPNRMKRPSQANYNGWSGRGGEQGMVYIQDEAEEVMQDKYGRERGTRNWEASIGHGARGGAMFKMSDDVMKEKQFLFDELDLTPRSYWDYSYFALWKMWMDKISQPYKVDSDEDVQAKKDAKEQAEREAKRLAKDKQQQDNKNKLVNKISDIRNKYSSLNLDKYSPDAKDKQRIQDLMASNRSDSRTLANKMSNSIKNKVKAIKRGLAALEYFENVTNISVYTYITAEEVIKPFFDKAMSLNESHAINEGQFSWFTQDTSAQIGSDIENKISVYMYDNKGNKWNEPNYEGYGEFGGKDFFDLTAEMNGYSEKDIIDNNDLRQFGIDLAYDKIQTKNQDSKLLFPALVENDNYDISNHDFTERPENDPNQGWFMEEEEESCPNCGSIFSDSSYTCYDCENYEDEDMYESKLFTSINEFKQYLNVNESISDKDWKRMSSLIQSNKDSASVAKTIKDKNKAIARFVAGILLTKGKGITFDLKYNEIIDKEKDYSNLPFKELGKTALDLGATIEEIQNVYDNTEIPQQYKEVTDKSYLSKKHLDSWVTGKVSKAIIDAGYDINYLNKGGNALTMLGKDAMRQSGRAWTIGYKTEINANGKTYKLNFDAITSESVDNNIVYYVIDDSSDSIFSKYVDGWKKYGIREFTKNIIELIKNETSRNIIKK